MTSASATVKVIKGLYSNIDATALYKDIPLETLSSPTEYYEVILDNTPCRAFIDLDGEMPNTMSAVMFKELIERIEERFLCDKEILRMNNLEDLIGVRNSSHFEALSVNPKTDERKKVAKVSFTLIFNRKIASCKEGREYAIKEILPGLQDLLFPLIKVSTKKIEGELNLDTSVYRKNGKIRCPNAYKIPQQKERVSRIIRGTLEDNLVQFVSEHRKEVTPVAVIKEEEPVVVPDYLPEPEPSPACEGVALPISTTDKDVIVELLKGLNDARFTTYEYWFKMTCVIKEEGFDYKTYDDICATKAGYNKANNKATYDKIVKQGKLKIATLWFWLKQDNRALFNELQQKRNDFFNMLDRGFADVDFAILFYNARPNKYFYSKKSYWWEIDANNRYYNEQDKAPPASLDMCITTTLREIFEDQRKNLNPEAKKSKKRSSALLDLYLNIGNSRHTKAIVAYLKDLCCIPDFDAKIDANTNLLAFNDKVFDFTTGEFRRLRPDDYVSKSCGFDIGDAMIDPTQELVLMMILKDIFPNEIQREYFMKCLSLSLFTNRFEMLYLLTGTGGNGKGLLCSYLTAGGGQYVLNAEQTFLTTVYKGGVANSCLASCEGVRIVLVSEPNADERSSNLNVDFVKMITGRDRISARMLHKNNKEFDPLFTTFLSCNTKPDIKKLDRGILRRLSIHPFTSEFKANPNPLNANEKQLDTRLKDLTKNKEFIKTFMLTLIRKAYANKDITSIEMPELSKDAVNDYVAENNFFKVWFDKNFTKVSMPEKLSKSEKDVWRDTHTHKTSFVLRQFSLDNEGVRFDAKALKNALTFNDITHSVKNGYLSVYYYLYDSDASQASTHSLSDSEAEEEVLQAD